MTHKKGYRQYKNMGLETSKEKSFIFREARKITDHGTYEPLPYYVQPGA